MTHSNGDNPALRAALAAREMTHEAAADRAHIARETVTRIANGKPPGRLTAYALADALDMPVEALFPDVAEAEARRGLERARRLADAA